MPELNVSKEGLSSLEKIVRRIRDWMVGKIYGEIRIRIVAGTIKEATYTETNHFDDHQ